MPPLSDKEVVKFLNNWIEECGWARGAREDYKHDCQDCPLQLIHCREARDAIVKALLGRGEG